MTEPVRSRALEKAVSTLASGDFYEAQQLFKTVYHRQRSKKQLKDSYATLKEGAELQLQSGHVTCGIELGLMLVEALTTDSVAPDTEAMAPLLAIIQAFPPLKAVMGGAGGGAGVQGEGAGAQGGEVVEECSRLVAAIIGWANKQPELSWQSCQRVHGAYAAYLWREYGLDQLQRVAVHVARSGQPGLHAQVLRAAMPPGAVDIFLTQAVLQVLAIARPHALESNLQHARTLITELMPGAAAPAGGGGASAGAPRITNELAWPPLCNFLGLLIEAIDRKSLPLVRLLRDRYAPSLSADPTWTAYLKRIESVYLGARDAAGGPGGGLGGLLGQLMQGMGGMGGEAGEMRFESGEEEEEGEEEGEGEGDREGRRKRAGVQVGHAMMGGEDIWGTAEDMSRGD